jgi:holo-[acyl-carrier protein] synthase
VFTAGEQAAAVRGGVDPDGRRAHERLAARFAAKEAARKALGDLRLPFHATEVVTDAAGAPSLHLHGAPSGLALSLAHDGGVAMAVVMGLRDGPDTAAPTATSATTTPATTQTTGA